MSKHVKLLLALPFTRDYFLFVTYPRSKMFPNHPMQDGWQELKGKVCSPLSKTADYQTSIIKQDSKTFLF